MAGAFSGYLLNSYQRSSSMSNYCPSPTVNGNVSFDASMHGNSFAQPSFSFFGSPTSFMNEGISDATAEKIAALQVKLNQKLGPEYISQRPGPGGGPKLTYAEGWKIINLANEVFGFNGWSSSIVNITTDYVDYNEESRRYNVGVTAVIKVTLRDGVFHEDVGYGMLENSKSKGAALDKCKKEAVTDGLKRALRNFGNLLGNCLYDKSYTQEVVKMKVPPPKFDKSDLHRRPEFEETKPNIASTSSTFSAPPQPAKFPTNNNHRQYTAPPGPEQKPIPSIPPHMRSEVNTSHVAPNSSTSKGKAPAHAGLPTPGTSPHQPLQQASSLKQPQQKVTFAVPNPPAGASASNSIRTSNAIAGPSRLPEKMEEDPDESFHCYSDDDAFLAAVDLVEGGLTADALADAGHPIGDEDMGRPIDDEVDAGQPIDFEEGLGGLQRDSRGHDGRQAASTTNANNDRAAGASTSNPNPGRASRMSAIAAALNSGSGNSASSNGGASTSTSIQRPMNTKPPYQHRNDQNVHNNQSSVSDGNDPNRSTMGGFHFPPSVNPQQHSGHATGTKRSAEVMGGATAGKLIDGHRGARPGMGLLQAAGGREVLGSLEITEGGSLKRARR